MQQKKKKIMPHKNVKKPVVFWRFKGAQKRDIGLKWVKVDIILLAAQKLMKCLDHSLKRCGVLLNPWCVYSFLVSFSKQNTLPKIFIKLVTVIMFRKPLGLTTSVPSQIIILNHSRLNNNLKNISNISKSNKSQAWL